MSINVASCLHIRPGNKSEFVYATPTMTPFFCRWVKGHMFMVQPLNSGPGRENQRSYLYQSFYPENFDLWQEPMYK